MYLLVSVIVVGLISSGDGQSPCPGTFEYINDELGIHGLIQIQPNGPVSAITTRVNFTIAARLPSNYVGQIKPVDEEHSLQRFNQGAPLTYRVHFPVTSPLPKLTSLVVNNQELCSGPPDFSQPGQYISTISLQHMLYLREGSPNSVLYPYEPTIPEKPIYNQPVYSKPVYEQPVYNQPVNKQPSFGRPDVTGIFNGPITITGVPTNTAGAPTQKFTLQGSNGAYYTLVVNKTQGSSQPGGGQNFQVFLETTTTSRYPQTPPAQFYPGFPENPTRFDQPPPDFNPYETERPPVRPIKTTPPPPPKQETPLTPPPDYNPYETTKRPVYRPSKPDQLDGQNAKPSLIPDSNNECGVIAGGNEHQGLIYNGQAYDRGQWPWLVALFKQRATTLSFICAGTLISPKHVVTAAHCMQQKNTKLATQDIVVKVGAYNVKDWGDDISQTRTLVSAVIHERYNASTLANDILMLTLDRSVEFNTNIRAACLWTGKTDQNRIIGEAGVVAGWGNSELGLAGEALPRMARVPIVSTAMCRASNADFHKLTSEYTFCAGDRNGVGPCLGDSGGGLYIIEDGRWRVRGIVSLSLRQENGDDTCNLNNYIVFTDAAKYDKWIRNIVQQSSLF
ncbi:spermosin-like [Ostrinia furnacalis]|uniref:spermosin-like n=1 Tax=Ostrinia furnacalis TaxID=93504 RepID=UPI00103A8108|nr:spermosin-like [Ostrinia furnacalis]